MDKYEDLLQQLENLNNLIQINNNDNQAVELQQQLLNSLLEYLEDPSFAEYVAQKSLQKVKQKP